MKRVAIVEGLRTPFARSGTLFKNLSAVDLGRIASRALLEKLDLDAEIIEEVIFGCVAQPADAANIARVIALSSSIPIKVPAYTVHRNCASGMEALTSAYEKIQAGYAELILVGGTESMTNIPLLLSKEMTELFLNLNKAKHIIQKLKALSKFRLAHLNPRIGLILGLTDPVCGLNMGQTAEVLAKEFGISRKAQDEFALMSHKKAIAAKSRLKEEIVPVITGKNMDVIVEDDNGPRPDSSLEALAKLAPYFERDVGTVTVGNSCQVTDGAAVLLVMPEERTRQLGYEPLGFIRSYAYAGLGPNKMGLGPAYATPIALKRAGLTLKDIQLMEINEAFASQVLACFRCLESKEFAQENFGVSEPIGKINLDIVNVNGGAIALGHPVGTTGARLILTILKEMKRRSLSLGLATLCVGGGQGAAVVVER